MGNLFERTTPEPNTGCWLWLGCVVGFGHGQISVGGRVKGAHRVAWELTRGPIPSGLFVLHECDQPSCINPAHLKLGTQADNMADRDRRRRQASGSRCAASKLSDADVAEIRRSTESTVTLGRRFGVARGTIRLTLNGTINRYR